MAMAAGLDPKLKRRVAACKSTARVTDAMGLVAPVLRRNLIALLGLRKLRKIPAPIKIKSALPPPPPPPKTQNTPPP